MNAALRLIQSWIVPLSSPRDASEAEKVLGIDLPLGRRLLAIPGVVTIELFCDSAGDYLYGNRSPSIEMDIALRIGDDDAVLRKSAGDHLAQVAADLGGISFDHVDPVAQLKSKGVLTKIGKECDRLRFLLHHAVPVGGLGEQFEHPTHIRAVSGPNGQRKAHFRLE